MGFDRFELVTYFHAYAYWDGPGGVTTFSFIASHTPTVRIDGITARNPDSVDHILRFEKGVSGHVVPLGDVVLPAGCGVDALPPVDCLSVIASPQLGSLFLMPGDLLQVTLGEALVDAVSIYVAADAGEFLT